MYVLAPIIGLFGTSFFTLRLAVTLFGALNAVLVWRVGRRLFSEQASTTAGLVIWVWPSMALWFSVRERCFYVLPVTTGLAAGRWTIFEPRRAVRPDEVSAEARY